MLFYFLIIDGRKRYSRHTIKENLSLNDYPTIKEGSKSSVLSQWPLIKRNLYEKYYRFYNRTNQSYPLKDYIPDEYWYSHVEPYWNDCIKATKLDDKNLYSLLLSGVKMPRTIVRLCHGTFLDENFCIISKESAILLCINQKRVIIKPSTLSMGGGGISIWEAGKDSISSLDKFLSSSNDLIIQEVIIQNDTLASIHPQSINTIRIQTLIYQDSVKVLAKLLRMGVNNSVVDNISSGGLFCGITDDGTLMDKAYDSKGNEYSIHPQGTHFAGIKIPGIESCLEIAKSFAPRFCSCSKCISWDFAIGKDSRPILIEVNLNYCQLDLLQISSGPIFGINTRAILEEIKHHHSIYSTL